MRHCPFCRFVSFPVCIVHLLNEGELFFCFLIIFCVVTNATGPETGPRRRSLRSNFCRQFTSILSASLPSMFPYYPPNQWRYIVPCYLLLISQNIVDEEKDSAVGVLLSGSLRFKGKFAV